MNVSKKQLKEQVANNLTVMEIKVKRSFVYVAIGYMHEGTLYSAFDFSKWATEDMRNVAKSTRLYQAMLKENCGCFVCRRETRYLANFIEKYNWSEERGIAIATGRAVADIVRQILGTSSISPEPTEEEQDAMFGKVTKVVGIVETPEKSKSGQLLDAHGKPVEDKAAYLGLKTDYARSKTDSRKMLNATS